MIGCKTFVYYAIDRLFGIYTYRQKKKYQNILKPDEMICY